MSKHNANEQNICCNNFVFSCFIIANGQQNRLVQVTSDKNDIPELIPVFKKNGKYGYINTSGRLIIPPKFNLALFFTEDCNLTQSPNENIRLYGKRTMLSRDR